MQKINDKQFWKELFWIVSINDREVRSNMFKRFIKKYKKD